MARPMKIFAVCDESGLTTVRVLIRHNMETGFRKNKDGTLVPAHFITNVEVRHGKNKVLTAEWGGGVSKTRLYFVIFGEGFLVSQSRSVGLTIMVSLIKNRPLSRVGDPAESCESVRLQFS